METVVIIVFAIGAIAFPFVWNAIERASERIADAVKDFPKEL